jgi:G:T-mismatch repair DNA endonuclease (very short patch repair protein)
MEKKNNTLKKILGEKDLEISVTDWAKKRERNMTHDREVTAMFESRGWTVLRIWECELKKKNRAALES